MELCRLWGQPPGWFYTLSKAEQIDLLAWHRVHAQPTTAKKGQGAARKALGSVEGTDAGKAWLIGG